MSLSENAVDELNIFPSSSLDQIEKRFDNSECLLLSKSMDVPKHIVPWFFWKQNALNTRHVCV
jgi:hypothetical protein